MTFLFDQTTSPFDALFGIGRGVNDEQAAAREAQTFVPALPLADIFWDGHFEHEANEGAHALLETDDWDELAYLLGSGPGVRALIEDDETKHISPKAIRNSIIQRQATPLASLMNEELAFLYKTFLGHEIGNSSAPAVWASINATATVRGHFDDKAEIIGFWRPKDISGEWLHGNHWHHRVFAHACENIARLNDEMMKHILGHAKLTMTPLEWAKLIEKCLDEKRKGADSTEIAYTISVFLKRAKKKSLFSLLWNAR